MFSYSQLLRVFLQKISSMNQSFSFELIENRPWDARENFQKFQNITKNWNKNGETPYSKNEKMFYLKIRIIRHSCGTSISHTVCQNISDHNWSNQHDSDKINDACIRKRLLSTKALICGEMLHLIPKWSWNFELWKCVQLDPISTVIRCYSIKTAIHCLTGTSRPPIQI